MSDPKSNDEPSETNGAARLTDAERAARALLGGSSTRRRSPSRRRTATRRASSRRSSQVELPGVGKVSATTLRRGLTLLGSLLGGGRRRSRSASAQDGGSAASSGLRILLLLVGIALVWWLLSGGARSLFGASEEPRAEGLPAAAAPVPAPAAPAPAPAERGGGLPTAATPAPTSPETLTDGLWWEGRGVVEKVLADDETPPRHQRFFLRDDRGRSLFFAHNVDAAPRVPGLKAGDVLSFRGEWRDNDRGGAMHWTHRSDDDRPGGWLERDGVRYE